MPLNTVYPNIPDNFVMMLKKTRSAKGISQKKLARMANCHPALISEIESGKRNCSYPRAVAFNEALDMGFDLPQPDYILINRIKTENGWRK